MENAQKKIVYSGIQPTGCITLGNYIGALGNWLTMQDDPAYQCIYAIADLHSLTVRQVPAELRSRCLSFYAQYLACGLSPEKNIMYIQSHVSAHTQLQWILDCYTYIGEMNRMTQYKDKSQKHADNINMGLMNYPVLMASDILLYNTSLVPIGIDQKQHLEITRDIAMRFNNLYSETFVVPEAYYPKLGAKIMSLQNPLTKMSKSDVDENATISLLDSNDVISRKIKRAVTDSDSSIRYDVENKPGVSNLLTIFAACTKQDILSVEKYFVGKTYKNLKDDVAASVIETLEPIRLAYDDLMKNKDHLNSLLQSGAERAEMIANKTLAKVSRKVGLVARSYR